MHQLLLLFCIGSSIFSLASGLTLVPKGSFITTADFSLVCDLQGTITTSVTFSDPSGSTPGICFAPPLACGSADGNILERDITKGTVVLNIIRQNIHIPASEGNWSCTDGSVTDHFSVKIYSITEPKLITQSTSPVAGDQVNVQIDCIYPYPDEIKIDYVKESDHGFVVKSIDIQFDNGTSTNCIVADSRAISMNGTFVIDNKDLVEEARIVVTVLSRGKRVTSKISSFTIKPMPDCSLDIFLYGFLPVFLIVLIVSIAIIIILKIERLPQQFGELAWKKLVIIAICFVVAIIIGVCLGLLIKGCDNKYLALGLSLLFGILIVVALIFALIYYHKKCESRRGVPERVLEYIPCSQSGQ